MNNYTSGQHFEYLSTVPRQNAENEALKKKILKLQATLNNTREELNETTEALVANVNRQHDPTVSHSRPMSMPASPLGLTPRVPRPQDVAYQAARGRVAPNPQNKVSRFLLVGDLILSKPNVCILHMNFR
jgi:hypothetical protein